MTTNTRELTRELRMLMKLIPLLVSSALLAGCAGSIQRPAEAPVAPARFQNAGADSVRNLPQQWWSAYRDPQLSSLVEASLRDHPDMRSALARLAAAEAGVGLAGAAGGPRLDARAGVANTRSSATTPTALALGGRSVEGNHYSVGLGASWELDLWQRVKLAVDAANARVEIAHLQQQSYALILSSEVAQQYWQLRAAEADLALLGAIRDTRAESERVLGSRFKSGLISELDVARARLETSNANALIEEARKRRTLAEHALATLSGRPIAEFAVAPAAASPLPAPPAITPGLPADVLARRPDMAESSQRLRALFAGVGIAEAAFYPSITLTSDFGFASKSLTDLVQSASRQYSIGPMAITLPIFDGGRNRANLAVAKAQYQDEVAQHQSRLLRALREVDDALTEIASSERQVAARNESLDAARRLSLIARSRYDKGMVTYLDVTDAERSVLALERQLVQNRAEALLASVQLVRALGGGWDGQK